MKNKNIALTWLKFFSATLIISLLISIFGGIDTVQAKKSFAGLQPPTLTSIPPAELEKNLNQAIINGLVQNPYKISLLNSSFKNKILTINLSEQTLNLSQADFESLMAIIDMQVNRVLEGSASEQKNLNYLIEINGQPRSKILAPIKTGMTTSSFDGKTVVISPGHGLYDNGGGWSLQRGYQYGIVEDYINLDVASTVVDKFSGYNATIKPSRQVNKGAGNHSSGNAWWQMDASEYVKSLGAPASVWGTLSGIDRDIMARPYYGNWVGANAMVSIHNNGGGGCGTETWYETGNGYQSQSLPFAQAIHNKIITRLRSQWNSSWCDRGVKGANGSYGENNYFHGPAVIIELGFMDNQNDNSALQNATFRDIVATAIRDAVVEYYGGVSTGTSLVVNPNLTPSFGGCASGWIQIAGYNGGNSYLTLNTNQLDQSTNWATWQPNVTIPGIYQIEAFVASRGDITSCIGNVPSDTSDAHYTITHANGTANVIGDQLPLYDQWLNLGNYYLNTGTGGKVYLNDLNNEANLSRYVSFGAVRFTLISAATNTPTATSTKTASPIVTMTSTPTKTNTITPTKTNTPTITLTNTATATVTNTITVTSTNTPTTTSTITPTVTPASTTQIFQSIAAQDGWVLESSETSTKGGTLNSSATTCSLGDDAAKKQYRCILSLNASAIPDNAVITKITLKMKHQGIIGGGNPIATLQGILVDIKNGLFGTSALQVTDFQATASKAYGPFSPTAVSGWYSIDLTSAKAYINKLTTNGGLTQIRLRFKLDDNNNTIANVLNLYSGNAPAASRPQLVIQYYVP